MADSLNLNSVLSLDVSPFELGLVQALRAAKEFATDIASALNIGIQDSIKRVAEQFKQSGNFDITTKQFQQLAFTAQQTGTNLTTMETAMRRMSSLTGKATFGQPQAVDTFKKLNIEIREFAKLDTYSQFLKMSEALSKVTNTSQRGELQKRAFGIAGMREGQFLKEIATQSDVFSKLVVGSNELASSLEYGAKQALGEITAIIDDIYNQIAAKVSPIITNVIHKMEEWGFTGKNLKQYIDAAFVSLVNFGAYGISFALTFKELWPEIWTSIKNGFQSLSAWFGSLTKDIGSLILKMEPAITAATSIFDREEESRLGKEIEEKQRANRSARDGFEKQKAGAYDYVKEHGYTTTNGKDNFGAQVSERRGMFDRMMNAIDKDMSKLTDRYSALQDKREKSLSEDSLLKTVGESLQNGTLFKDLPALITEPFGDFIKKFADKMNLNLEESWKIIGPLVYSFDKPEARQHGGGDLSIPEDEKKEKKMHSSPLGYAINATNTRASVYAMQLAHESIQKVEDVGVKSAIEKLTSKLTGNSNVTTLQD